MRSPNRPRNPGMKGLPQSQEPPRPPWRPHEGPSPEQSQAVAKAENGTRPGTQTRKLAREAEQRRATGAGQPHALAVAAHHDKDGPENVVFEVVEIAAVPVLTDAVHGRRLRRLARRGSARGVHRVAVLRPARVMRAASGTLSRSRRRKGNLAAPAPGALKTYFGLGFLDWLRLALIGVRLADAGIGQTKRSHRHRHGTSKELRRSRRPPAEVGAHPDARRRRLKCSRIHHRSPAEDLVPKPTKADGI